MPDAVAINALASDNSDDFTVTVSYGDQSGSKTLAVNLAGANDAPVVTTALVGNTGVVGQAFAGSTTALTVGVTYTDAEGNLDLSTININDLIVTRNGGGTAPVITGVSVSGTGSSSTATYSIAPAGGAGWAETLNGTYTIALAASQVGDGGSPPAFVAAVSSLATFTVHLDTIVVPPPLVVPPPVVSELVDGVPVQTQTQSDGAGGIRQIVEVPIITEGRGDDRGQAGQADVPLVKAGNGNSLLEAGLPIGVGLHVEGPASIARTPQQALTDLIRAIEARTDGQDQTGDRAEMTAIGRSFLDEMPANTELIVRTVVPTVPAGTTQAPSQPIVISAPASAAGTQEALVIDVRNLPPGSVIELENIEFAAIIGAVKVTGGAGSQKVTGDGSAQVIVLGEDDDVLYGGAGDDVIGSQGGNDRIHGEVGNDRMFGGIGDDTLDGGSGIDIVRFNGKASDFVATRNLDGTVTIADLQPDREGTDTLGDVELVRFEDGVRLPVVPVAPLGTFDEELYLHLNPDVANLVNAGMLVSSEQHYALFGAAEGRGGMLTLEVDFYLAQNPDVQAAIVAGQFQSALQHFVLYGMKEGRDPTAFFSTEWYLSQNVDVAAAVAAGTTTAWKHYDMFGWREGRDPSQWFDSSEYLVHNADVAGAGVNPLIHLLDFGMREGRLAYANDAGLWG